MAKTDDAGAGVKKTPTKKDELIRLLKTKAGADVATLGERFGWQPHTVRAAITGLRKAGHVVVASRPGGGGASRYRIMSAAEQARAETQTPTTAKELEVAPAGEPAEAPDAR